VFSFVLIASMGTTFAWPDQDISVYNTGGSEKLDPRGAQMLVNMGFAGMGYCPRAFVNEHNAARQTSLFEWIFKADDVAESIHRAVKTLEAYKRTGSTFFDMNPNYDDGAYELTGKARLEVQEQFGTLDNAKEKIGFCLTALVAIATGKPLIGGLPIHCPDRHCHLHIGNPAEATPLIHHHAMEHDDLPVHDVPRPAGWPRGPEALHAAGALAVFAPQWGLQAIVTRAQVPVVFAEGKMHLRHGVVVSFRGTTSFSSMHAAHPLDNVPGEAHVVDRGTAEEVASGAANHQWAMNLRTKLTRVLNGAYGGVRTDRFHTMDGISHEAALLMGISTGSIRPQHMPKIFDGTDRARTGGVCDAVREVTDGHGALPIFVTGHSKGGALSILGSYLLQLCLEYHDAPSRVTTVLSVEGPRTGDSAWAAEFLQYMEARALQLDGSRFNVFRTVKRNDPVTEGPPPTGRHRHVPGLLMVPVVTALDVAGGGPAAIRLPPVYVCDRTESLRTALEWDVSRPQRGRVFPAQLPAQRTWDSIGGECLIQSDERMPDVFPANALEGGRLDGVQCNLCTGARDRNCVEADYKAGESVQTVCCLPLLRFERG
jgi:hypothetical protein